MGDLVFPAALVYVGAWRRACADCLQGASWDVVRGTSPGRLLHSGTGLRAGRPTGTALSRLRPCDPRPRIRQGIGDVFVAILVVALRCLRREPRRPGPVPTA
jgi:hypothetical protein